VQDASIGDGPVDAIYSAIQRLTGVKADLTDYRIRSISKGRDAQGEAMVESGTQWPDAERPRPEHRYSRSQRAGVPGGDQSAEEHGQPGSVGDTALRGLTTQ